MTDPDRSLGAPGSRMDAPITRVRADAFTIPLDHPESDGTLTWSDTTLVIARVEAGPHTGVGYTYAPAACAGLVTGTLGDVLVGRDPMAIGAAWAAMAHEVRNMGRRGIASAAISALDVAMWDLKAQILGVSVTDLVGGYHDHVPAYGSGGFTNLDDDQLRRQVAGWAGDDGLHAVKIKVGTHPDDDARRVALVRSTVGPDVQVFVDANGAYTRKQALLQAERFAEHGVRWFEEPVSSDDLDGLHLLRDRAPAGMEITAGEYGWDVTHFRELVRRGAVYVLQADVTRSGGITAVLRAGALCDAEGIDLSSHCAPQLSAHALTGVWHMRHLEYFADHTRIESLAFDGVLTPRDGALWPDRSRYGLGLEVRWPDLERYRVHTR